MPAGGIEEVGDHRRESGVEYLPIGGGVAEDRVELVRVVVHRLSSRYYLLSSMQ